MQEWGSITVFKGGLINSTLPCLEGKGNTMYYARGKRC